MVKSIEMKCVEVTLLTFINLPIDWVPVGVILRNSRWGGIDKPLKLVRYQTGILGVGCLRAIDGTPKSERFRRLGDLRIRKR